MKWENYIRKFDVNGIPQINLFDREGNLKSTFIGKQGELSIRESLDNFERDAESQELNFNPKLSTIKENKNNEIAPRSHG
jgi:thioredoxin-like negative regulator of GroEL